jgi:hypothetical protein
VEELFARIWGDLVARVGGPMTFRILLQPIMAGTLAIRAGLQDAREGRPPYFWPILIDKTQRGALLREGWQAVGRIFLLAVIMDGIYQLIVHRWIYPIELLMVGVILAVTPYVLLRGPVNRLSRSLRKINLERSPK